MMRAFGLFMLALFAASSAACAAAGRQAPAAAEAGARQPEAEQPKPAYERILGAFSIDPETAVFLDPVMCEHHFYGELPPSGLHNVAAAFERIGAPRGEAAARVNLGAVLWYSGDAEGAYREVMRSLSLFAELGDVDGLAHTYEWLGWFLHESGESERAAEHLAMSYQLYRMLGNRSAADRVLAYGE